MTAEEQAKLILVADDDDDVRELVVFRLERAGYDVVTAEDGQQAIELARERQPQLCVLDIVMPNLDGFEVTRMLRAAEGSLASVPVLLLTASIQEAAVSEGFEAGADDYLRKPFSPQELLARVASMLERG